MNKLPEDTLLSVLLRVSRNGKIRTLGHSQIINKNNFEEYFEIVKANLALVKEDYVYKELDSIILSF